MTQSLATLHCSGVEIDWNEFHRPFEGALSLLDLPTYSWNDKNYWIMYNGDRALTKGNNFYDTEGVPRTRLAAPVKKSNLRTSTVQEVIEENFEGVSGKVIMQADLMQPDFLAAANGHRMNGCGVVTSSIHADIGYTLGQYLYKKLRPNIEKVDMNIANLEVLKGLVARKDPTTPQLIQVSIETTDIYSNTANLNWYNVDSGLKEPFASASIYYGDASEWLTSWIPSTHLIMGRIQELERLAEEGTASRFSHNYAYLLFANKLVDYATKYRGMQSVIVSEFEAVADVVLSSESEKGAIWTIPPYFIDSVAHLAGFVMNVSDAVDTETYFSVTPGWTSMRFARPLVAGGKYRSYTKMIPTHDDPTTYLGDVYILQGDSIVGLVGGIKFRRYPRILLNRFFSAPDVDTAKSPTAMIVPKPEAKATPSPAAPIPSVNLGSSGVENQTKAAVVVPVTAFPATNGDRSPPLHTEVKDSLDTNSVSAKAIALIAEETALEIADLHDEASFESLGIDSLMSLVLAEKFREELGVSIGGSLFLEYPTVGDLKAWLDEYYS